MKEVACDICGRKVETDDDTIAIFCGECMSTKLIMTPYIEDDNDGKVTVAPRTVSSP